MSKKGKIFSALAVTFILLCALVFAAFASSDAGAGEDGLIPVTWCDSEGNVIGESRARPGETAVVPEGLSVPYVEGWLDYIPLEWNESLVIPEDATEYRISEKAGGEREIVAAVELLFNTTVASHFQYNLYIPTVKDGISVTSVTLNSDRTDDYNKNISKLYTINGKQYNCTSVWPGMIAAITGATPYGISFTYGGETYSVSSTVDMVRYCNYVLDNNYSESAKVHAANAANYLYRGALVLENATAAAKVEGIVSANTERIIRPVMSEFVAPDTASISKYVSGVQLIVAAYGPKFRFNLTEEGCAATVSLSMGTQTANYKASGYIETKNTYMYLLNSTEISVTPAGGAKVSLYYSFANYAAAICLDEGGEVIEGREALFDFLASMYGYARATYKKTLEGHTFRETVVPPTCSSQGYTVYSCTECNYFYTDTYVAALGGAHDLEYFEAKEPTSCADGGWAAYERCKNCSYTTFTPITIDHNYSVSVKAPVCTEGGYTSHTCSACGNEYRDNYTDPTGHTMGNWYLSSPITKDSDGEMRSSCLNCAYFETKVPTVISSGNFGAGSTPTSSVQYKLFDNGTLKVYGSGKTFGCGWNGANQPFKDYRSNITSLIICEGVTGTSGGDFAKLMNLEKVEFADSFTYIGTNAFMDSFKNGITELTIPKTVTYIGTFAFGYYADSTAIFTDIIIENPDLEFYTNPSNTKNELSIFNRGNYNSAITFYSYGTSNNVSAYAEKIGAKYVNLSDAVSGTVDNLSYSFFEGTLELSAVDKSAAAALPASAPWLSRISASDVTKITVGEGIERIPENYFKDYTSLVSVSVSEGVTAVEDGAFATTSSISTPLSVNLPESISYLGDGVFENRTGVTVKAFSGSAADGFSAPGVTVDIKRVFRLLLLGNSLSLDAADNTSGGTESMLYNIIKSMLGENSFVEIGTLYSGARTCAWHATMARDEVAAYQFSVISDDTGGLWQVVSNAATSRFGLEYSNWNAITVQPYGNETLYGVDDTTTGITDSYKDSCFLDLCASLPFILDYIWESSPSSEVYYYLTWASSTSAYLNTGLTKYEGMVDVAIAAAKNGGENKSFSGIIPVGTAIQNARSTYLALLNYTDPSSSDAQKNLQRDAVHLSKTVGRYIASLTFAEMLVPESMRVSGYVLPEIKNSPAIGALPAEYTELARLAVSRAVASAASEGEDKYMPVSISGYTEDPAASHAAKISAMSFANISASSAQDLLAKITAIASVGMPSDMKITAALTADITLTSEAKAFSATLTVTFGYSTVTVTVNGTATLA